MRLSSLLLLAALAGCSAKWRGGRGKRGGEAGGGGGATNEYDGVECKKCMSTVMRLLVPAPRGCPEGNGSFVASSTASRVPSAFCDAALPKKRQCIVYSFGTGGVWDFDNVRAPRARTHARKSSPPPPHRHTNRALTAALPPRSQAMQKRGCRVLSFDPMCCGAAHRVKENHDFIPVALATYDGLADSTDPKKPNVTIPVLSMRTIMTSYEHPKIDVLRLKASSNLEWKGLKNLVNTGTIQDIRQLSLNLNMGDPSMWEEYKYVLTGIRAAGFLPFYVAKQPDAEYLRVQEGSQALYSKYEVAYSNTQW